MQASQQTNYKQTSDDDLMRRVRDEDDEEAFGELYSRHSRATLGFLIKHTRSRSVADDLNQEVWIKVWSRRRTFAPGGAFQPWLWAITLNTLNDWRRKQKRRPEAQMPETQVEDTPAGPSQHWFEEDAVGGGTAWERGIADDLEFKMKFSVAWERLSPDEQDLLSLKHFEGYTVEEIARPKGVKADTLRYRLKVAERRLIENLEGQGITAI